MKTLRMITVRRLPAMLAVVASLVCLWSTAPLAAADQTVKLVLDGAGATTWAIGPIKPGDSGIQTLTLSNSSAYAGVLHIWISSIVNTEGLNPESESGNTAEPGELGDYLLFKTSSTSTALSTNIAMPALINNLPYSAADARYIKIDPFPAGQTVILNWEWELPAQTGNDVQGDGILFDINYMLEQTTTTTPCWILIIMLGLLLILWLIAYLLSGIRGKVFIFDTTTVVPNALVTLVNSDGEEIRRYLTKRNGKYLFRSMKRGDYQLVMASSLPNYEQVVLPEVLVHWKKFQRIVRDLFVRPIA